MQNGQKKQDSIPSHKTMRTLLFTLTILMILTGGCKQKESEGPLRIAVSANVQFAFEEIESEFEKKTGIQVERSLGSSGKLTAQIQNGAPYHVFLAANMKYPQALLDSGDASGEIAVYAKGEVVAWSHKDGFDVDNWTETILSPSVKQIALPNPKNAPYGVATVECLKKEGIYEKIKNRIVMGENISQTNQFIVSESADIGFTARSVVLSPEMKGVGHWSNLPTGCYEPIQQGVVILKEGMEKRKADSEAFRDFLFTDQVKEIFDRYGYTTN